MTAALAVPNLSRVLRGLDLPAIGGRIKKAREDAGLSQEDLADVLRVHKRTIANYEAGDTKPYDQIQMIADVTGTTLIYLLHGVEEGPVAYAGVKGLEEIAGRLAQLPPDDRGRIEEELEQLVGALRLAAEQSTRVADRLAALQEPDTDVPG